MRCLFSIFFCFLLFSCQQSAQKAGSFIDINIDNLQIDTVGVRLLHYMDGKELLDTTIAVRDTLRLDGLQEDMYLLAIYWPRTYISHRIFKDKLFDPETGDDYQLTKAFYVNPDETDQYVFYLDTVLTAQDIEMSGYRKIKIRTDSCYSCRIADYYWDNYNDFFARKELVIDHLNASFYDAVDNSDTSYQKKYKAIDSLKNAMWTDLLYYKGLDSLVQLYPANRASTFFVFYQLYQERDFLKHQHLFDKLTGDAKKTKYYRMLVKQYEVDGK